MTEDSDNSRQERLARCSAPAEALGVLAGVSPWSLEGRKLWVLVARTFPFWDEGLAEAVGGAGMGDEMMDNPAVPAELIDLVAERGADPRNFRDPEPLLKLARKGGIKAGSKAMESLLRLASPTQRPREAISILAEIEGLSDETWFEIVARSKSDPVMVRTLVYSTHLSPAGLQEILGTVSWDDGLLKDLVRAKRFLQEPSLIPALLQFALYRDAKGSLPVLVPHLDAATFASAFKKAISGGRGQIGEAAVVMLESAESAQLGDLSQEDLLPLLGSEDAQKRLTAIRAAGKMEMRTAPEEKAARRR